MINANELRIGNWVKYFEDTVPAKVDAISDDILVASDWWPPKHLIPIPLTPEIMQQCGFKYTRSMDSIHFWKNIIQITQINFHADYTEWELVNNPVPSIKIQYLHQLQNLFFALTNEELQIKELNREAVEKGIKF